MIATSLPGDWLGYIAATLTTVAFVPQAWRTLRTRDTRALSLLMYLVFTVGIAFWLAYGLVLGSWPIIVSNALTLLLAGTILALKLRHG
jgi:MtN3 and saliva related transmembrane protein